jgi:hypothetical protein
MQASANSIRSIVARCIAGSETWFGFVERLASAAFYH